MRSIFCRSRREKCFNYCRAVTFRWGIVFLSVVAAMTSTHPASAQMLPDSTISKPFLQSKFIKTAGLPLMLTFTGLYISSEDAIISRFDIKQEVDRSFPDFDSSLDDYLRYVPPALVFGLEPLGIKSKHSLRQRVGVFLLSNMLTLSLVFPLKGITQVRRPNERSSASFPSLHSAQAFLGATFVHKELGHHSIWYSVTAYTMAAVTASFRVLKNKHWASDVLVGAALGILSTNLVYLAFPFNKKIKKKGLETALLPFFSANGYGASMVIFLN